MDLSYPHSNDLFPNNGCMWWGKTEYFTTMTRTDEQQLARDKILAMYPGFPPRSTGQIWATSDTLYKESPSGIATHSVCVVSAMQ